MECSFLSSLTYFHPEYMSLTSPHKVLTTAGRKTYEVCKAKIQLQFLSSQYPCGSVTRHWSTDNPGLCSYPPCISKALVETPEHILLFCPAYSAARHNMINMCLQITNPASHHLVMSILLGNCQTKFMQFLMDCSTIPEVISCAQQYGNEVLNDLFYCSRTWCFSLHRERMKRLDRWIFK